MIQVYTGDGKGKTTAAVGLAIRASAHFKVLFVQFIKNGNSAEVQVLKKLSNIDFKAFGSGEWIVGDRDKSKETKNSHRALKYIGDNLADYGVIVMDEAITAVNLGVINEDDIINLLNKIPEDKEVILTGRGATGGLIEMADLVTEMKKIKHYYEDKGIEARKGIEL